MHLIERRKPVPQVGFGQRADAYRAAGLEKPGHITRVGVGAMNGNEVAVDSEDLVEQLHGPAAILGQALLDLGPLLFHVHVESESPPLGLAMELDDGVERRGPYA